MCRMNRAETAREYTPEWFLIFEKTLAMRGKYVAGERQILCNDSNNDKLFSFLLCVYLLWYQNWSDRSQMKPVSLVVLLERWWPG